MQDEGVVSQMSRQLPRCSYLNAAVRLQCTYRQDAYRCLLLFYGPSYERARSSAK